MDTTETLWGRKPAFVLVPGSWCGAWCWKPVADRLRNAGHTVFPMSLTGLAERSHLLSDRITLETHVMDVVNLIKYNDLRDVVLVGHSYAGIVLTAVAERIPQCLRHIVYLDAMVPKPGECAMDLIPNDEAEQRVLRARHDGGISIPAPTPGHFATEAMREWFRDHMTPQPIKPYFDRIDVRVPQGNGVPVTYVSCTPVKLHPIALSVERARRLPLWRVVEIASGHNVHLHRPDDVAEILMECAERA
ncbi:alpha/beta fold hydrolase [Bilophila wadsworthia]|uniref:alpha/beta fold hydrolase n=1 Tax=Bilophila wadsworthia TaxID=35833 RepID=UPI0032BF4413